MGLLAGCGKAWIGKMKASGKVYYLNFREEGKEEWEKLAEAYTEETGVPVTVKTVKAGIYDQKLKSEMKKDDAPTMFLGFFIF